MKKSSIESITEILLQNLFDCVIFQFFICNCKILLIFSSKVPLLTGLKTYFIAGRSKELESASNRLAGTASDSDSAVGGVGVVSGSAAFLHADSGGASSASATGGCPGNGSNAQKLSFRKVKIKK